MTAQAATIVPLPHFGILFLLRWPQLNAGRIATRPLVGRDVDALMRGRPIPPMSERRPS